MHGKVSVVRWVGADEPLRSGLPDEGSVTRYHSLVLRELPPSLQPLAYTTDSYAELMAFRHATLPIHGVQFHPEALLTAHGVALLRNWVKYCIIAQSGRVEAALPNSTTL